MKELKNGMAIHCKTKDEARALVQYYGMGHDMVGYWDQYKEETCYFYEPDSWSSHPWTYQDRAWALRNPDKFTLVEFKDLLGSGEYIKLQNAPRPDYVICELRDGTILDFDGYCNRVTGWRFMDGYIKFVSENCETLYEANLAVIPEREIKKIMFYNGDETLQKSIYKEEKELSDVPEDKR